MALGQRLGAILLFGPVLQTNATRTRAVSKAYDRSRLFRATQMRHGQRRCSPRVRGRARPCELLLALVRRAQNRVAIRAQWSLMDGTNDGGRP